MRDFEIRQHLKVLHLHDYYCDRESKVVDELELPVTGTRIDVAVINGSFHGFEIKGASDTLSRLQYQIEGYTKVFDYLAVVSEKKYLDKIIELVPEWVSVIECVNDNGYISLSEVQHGSRNIDTNPFFQAKMLWKEEMINLLSNHNIKFRKSDRTWLLCEAIVNNFDKQSVSNHVRTILKNRANWKSN